eukprot:5689918-Pyramimonas_sp.AAC.1
MKARWSPSDSMLGAREAQFSSGVLAHAGPPTHARAVSIRVCGGRVCRVMRLRRGGSGALCVWGDPSFAKNHVGGMRHRGWHCAKWGMRVRGAHARVLARRGSADDRSPSNGSSERL